MQEMYQLLVNVTSTLCVNITSNSNQSYLIKVLVLLIIYFNCGLLDRFSSDINNQQFVVTLLQNLSIDSLTYQEAYDNILVYYKQHVLQLLDTLLVNTNKFVSEWIFVVPIIHLLSEQYKPFDVLQSISWDFSKSVYL